MTTSASARPVSTSPRSIRSTAATFGLPARSSSTSVDSPAASTPWLAASAPTPGSPSGQTAGASAASAATVSSTAGSSSYSTSTSASASSAAASDSASTATTG